MESRSLYIFSASSTRPSFISKETCCSLYPNLSTWKRNKKLVVTQLISQYHKFKARTPFFRTATIKKYLLFQTLFCTIPRLLSQEIHIPLTKKSAEYYYIQINNLWKLFHAILAYLYSNLNKQLSLHIHCAIKSLSPFQ